MPVIVVFGDSNTWGSDPATGARFSRAQRWPTVMQRELGPEFDVIAEGLRGRTTVHDDPIEPFRSGADALPPCLMSHAPVDLVILALPIAWLALDGKARGFLTWEKSVLFALWILPLVSRATGSALHIPLGAPILMLGFAMAIRRAMAEVSVGIGSRLLAWSNLLGG